jgi:hypothetical protein
MREGWGRGDRGVGRGDRGVGRWTRTGRAFDSPWAGQIPGSGSADRAVGIRQPVGRSNPRIGLRGPGGGDSTACGPIKSPDRTPGTGRRGFDSLWADQIPGSGSADRAVGIRQPVGRSNPQDRAPRTGRWGFDSPWAGQIPGGFGEADQGGFARSLPVNAPPQPPTLLPLRQPAPAPLARGHGDGEGSDDGGGPGFGRWIRSMNTWERCARSERSRILPRPHHPMVWSRHPGPVRSHAGDIP